MQRIAFGAGNVVDPALCRIFDEAKRGLGEILPKAQHTPVEINKNGKPVAAMVSAVEYAETDGLRKQLFQQERKRDCKISSLAA